MPGILGTRASLASDLSLILEIIILVIFVVGIRFGRRKTSASLATHRAVMRGMVVLQSVVLLLVMIPSLVANFSAVVAEPSAIGFPLTRGSGPKGFWTTGLNAVTGLLVPGERNGLSMGTSPNMPPPA